MFLEAPIQHYQNSHIKSITPLLTKSQKINIDRIKFYFVPLQAKIKLRIAIYEFRIDSFLIGFKSRE